MTFGAAALRLSGVAARLLGWRPGEFWGATPAEFAAALAPPDAAPPLSRDDITRLMELDDGRPG
jgi:hypothetical protein